VERGVESRPPAVLLTWLRKRIKEERCIALLRRLLQAGGMEQGPDERTYAGAPHGGRCSPIWMQIVWHAFEGGREAHWQAQAPVPQRTPPAYARLTRRLTRWRGPLQGRIPLGRQPVAGLRHNIADAQAARPQGPSSAPRQPRSVCRWADEYLVGMGGDGPAEAPRRTAALATWLQDHRGLRHPPATPRMTHWRQRVRCLGSARRGHRPPHGTRWARRRMPSEAARAGKQRVKRRCGYTQMPATDRSMRGNALRRGWTPDDGSAANAPQRFGSLTGGGCWRTAHDLGRTHRRAIPRLLAHHDGADPRTGKRAF
jgi:hypothetical protein